MSGRRSRQSDGYRRMMAGNRDGAPVRSRAVDAHHCGSKLTLTKQKAKHEAARRTRRDGEPWDWYRCGSCGQYHLGHRAQGLPSRADGTARIRALEKGWGKSPQTRESPGR